MCDFTENVVLEIFPKKIEKPLDKFDFVCYANDNISNALTGKKISIAFSESCRVMQGSIVRKS